jgi:amino acid transporter
MPLNALYLVTSICLILALIYIGSSTAFNAIVSISSLSLNISYIPPILFMLLKRVSNQHIEYGPIKLGRYGILINIASLAYILYTSTWIPFPTILPVTAQNMNYAGPITLVIIFGALIDWFLSGSKRFEVPVAPNVPGI